MNYDMAFVASILESRNLGPAIRAGVSPTLLDEEGEAYFEYLLEHYSKFGEVPTLEHFLTVAPEYDHMPPDDTIEVIIEELKTRNLSNDLNDLLESVASANEADPWEALEKLVSNMGSIMVRNRKDSNDHVLGQDGDHMEKALRRLRDKGGLEGYPWPWEYLNQNTLGVCPGHVYYFYGREKSRKTFLLLFIGLFYWSAGHKVLFVLRDTPLAEMRWRAYAMALAVNYLDFLKGALDDSELKMVTEVAEELLTGERFIFVDQDGGFAGFQAKVEEYEPDIVIHDYPKGIADDEMGGKNLNQEPRYVAKMIDDVKNLAIKKKLPVFLAGHANREGIKGKGRNSGEMAWSDHIARRVDGAFRIITDDYENNMALYVTAGRSMQQKTGFTIKCDLCETFGEFVSTDTSWVHDFEANKEAEEKAEAKRDKKAPPAEDDERTTKMKRKQFEKNFSRSLRR